MSLRDLIDQTITKNFKNGLPQYKAPEPINTTELKVLRDWEDLINWDCLVHENEWDLDTETIPVLWQDPDTERLIPFDEETIKNHFLDIHVGLGKKVTKTTHNSAETFYQKQRKHSALTPMLNGIALLQIRAKNTIYLFKKPANIKRALSYLPYKTITAHNAKFDIKVIGYHTGLYPAGVFDTMLAKIMYNYQTDTSRKRANLGATIMEHLGIDLPKDQAQTDWSKPLTQEQVDYAVNDVRYLGELRRFFQERLPKDILELENQLVIEIAKIELRGIPVNSEALRQRARELDEELIEYAEKLEAIELNPRSSKQILEYFENKGISLPNTAYGTLVHYKHIEEINWILKARKLTKERDALYDYADKAIFGRIYANFNQIGASTGRMSSSKPNMQQIPRPAKNIIYDTSNVSILKADYPAIELRLASVIMGEENMLNAFKDNADLHKRTASFVNEIPESEVTKEIRQQAKAVNFGLIYGMGAKTFKEYAYTGYGVTFTEDEAKEIRNKFFKAYPSVLRFHNFNSDKLRKQSDFVNYTLMGRSCLVDRFTNANNTRVQGSGADLLKLAILKFAQKAQGTEFHIISMIHDELIIECPKGQEEIAGLVLQEAMNEAVNEMLPQFRTEVDLEEVE